MRCFFLLLHHGFERIVENVVSHIGGGKEERMKRIEDEFAKHWQTKNVRFVESEDEEEED